MKQINDVFFEDLYNIQAICVYGESDFEFYSFLKEWLEEEKERKIIFLEEDSEKYEKSKKHINKIFTSKSVKNIFIKNSFEECLKKIAWDCSYLNLKILKSNVEKRKDSFEKISQILNELHLGVNLTSHLYADFGIKIFENIYNNLLKTNDFVFFDTFCNKFKNIPAIIAGAGPSLDKNIHLLKEAYDKALIFVGGSALNIFSKKNVRHHFSGFIDQSCLFKRFKNNYFFENVFFYTNQMNYHNFSIVHSNKVLLSDYGAYPLENWMYDQLNIKQQVFEGGWNVTTFLIKIAAYLGCNPIYFVGLDLCFKKNKYAKGVTKTKKIYEHIKLTNINNETVYSQKDWFLAKKWIEEFVLANKKIKFINATEGGLKLENINNLKLSDALNSLDTNSDLFGYVHSIYQQMEKKKFDKQKVIQVLKIIKKSFERSDILCDEYLSEIQNNNIDENLIRLQKEIAYVYLIDPVWQIWKYVILRKTQNTSLHILINKLIFFKTVIANHLIILKEKL